MSKSEILDFAKAHLNDQYVVVKKEKGEATSVKVKAPKINPIKLRKNVHSKFYTDIKNEQSMESKPEFTDFKKIVSKNKIGDYYYLKNSENDLFSLNIVYEFGSFDEPLMALATEYLKTLGSQVKTNEQINTNLFKNGVSWNVLTNSKTMTLRIEGLNSNYKEGIKEVFELINHPKANPKSFVETYTFQEEKT